MMIAPDAKASFRRSRTRLVPLAAAAALAACSSVSRLPEQTYWGASSNWAFRNHYPPADRLFNAFDYGHAILYERLLRSPGQAADAAPELEGREFDYITRQLLVHPPSLPLEEHAIAPTYTTAVPELLEVFEWAHMLHRQLYDALADERLDSTARDAQTRALLRYYTSRADLALSTRPKSMALMEDAPYSLAFRRQDPKFNGLLWAYHWYQLAIYDALLGANDAAGRRRNVDSATTHFWALIGDPPERMPTLMPMAAAVSPRLAMRYPEMAIIFDNLHSLHDVAADILASPVVPPNGKRAAILRAIREFQDTTTEVVTLTDWRSMALDMGVEKMGGVAPTPAASSHR
jgi:hypothetical protein